MVTPEVVMLGRVIRLLRADRELTQEKLAELSELDTTYISMIERAVRVPTIRTIFSLARALKVAPSYMIKLVEDML